MQLVDERRNAKRSGPNTAAVTTQRQIEAPLLLEPTTDEPCSTVDKLMPTTDEACSTVDKLMQQISLLPPQDLVRLAQKILEAAPARREGLPIEVSATVGFSEVQAPNGNDLPSQPAHGHGTRSSQPQAAPAPAAGELK